jgi:Fic family protein
MTRGTYTTALTQLQYGIPGTRSKRHRVHNNLPGSPAFCPLIFLTHKLQSWIGQNLAAEAAATVARVPKDLLARTAAFLLLKDSRSSYAIEGERPPQNRIQRWGRVIGEAGKLPFDLKELFRLQRIVIGDDRLIDLGLRTDDGFVGEHDRATGAPLPDHIDARPGDLPSLMQGLIDFDHGPAKELDPVIAATMLAFGFVYIHPLQDGNGRLHRYLIHHVLSRRGFHPHGVVFPVSFAILERIVEYKGVLESYSSRLLPLIEWEPTPRGNVHVLNETADFYRYPDLTLHAEFLYDAVAKTIREDLPKETDFLARYDRFRSALQNIIDMPETTANLLFRFLDQNSGQLSKRAREREFASLTAQEVALIEELHAEIFA